MGVKLATGFPGLEAQNILQMVAVWALKAFIILTESAGAFQPSQLPPGERHHTDPCGPPSLDGTSEADELRFAFLICKAPKESPGFKVTTRR